MDEVKRVDVILTGDRNMPLGTSKLPAHYTSDLAELVEIAQKQNPTITSDDCVRAIWRLGSRGLRNNLVRGISPNSITSLPPATPYPHKESQPDGSGTATDGDGGGDAQQNQGVDNTPTRTETPTVS